MIHISAPDKVTRTHLPEAIRKSERVILNCLIEIERSLGDL